MGERSRRSVETHPRAGLGLCVVLFSAAHFVLFMVLFLATFSSGMARFDSGAEPGLMERLAEQAVTVLSLPLLPLVERLSADVFAGLLGYIPIAANSVCWGVVLTLIWLRVTRGRGAWLRSSIVEEP